MEESSRYHRRRQYSYDDASVSSSGSDVSCRRHHGKGRNKGNSNISTRYEKRGPQSSRRRNYSPESSCRSSSTAPSNVMSIDTAENSESRLQDIGRVVKASDLTDYSDHYTLGSREVEEFEKYLQKHKSRGHRNFYASDSEGSSAIYSLDSRNDKAVAESDDTSGVVAVDSRDQERTGGLGCGYKACFCMDDESIQGSYGGLREDEVLVAATGSFSSHKSMEFTDGGETTDCADTPEISTHTVSRRVERMESHEESTTSNTLDTEGQDDAETVKTEEPSGVSRFFCGWGHTSSPSDGDTDEDDEYDLPEVVSTTMTHQGTESMASRHSSNVVWQRSAEYDSTEESIEEERADAIAKRARANNILNKFKNGTPNSSSRKTDEMLDQTRSGMDKDEPNSMPFTATSSKNFNDTESTEEEHLEGGGSIDGSTKDTLNIGLSGNISAENVAVDLDTQTIESKIGHSAQDEHVNETSPELVSASLHRTFVLGDNVEVTGMTEVEAGNGDTGFLIFLRVSRSSLTKEGEATVRRFLTSRGEIPTVNGLYNLTDMSRSWRDAEDGLEVCIVVENDTQYPVHEAPRLLIEENASLYLENLSRLSEASYYCLDRKTKHEVTRIIQSHDSGACPDFSARSVLAQDSLKNESSLSPSSKEGVTQFIFCMRTVDMNHENNVQVQNQNDELIRPVTGGEDEPSFLQNAKTPQSIVWEADTQILSKNAHSSQIMVCSVDCPIPADESNVVPNCNVVNVVPEQKAMCVAANVVDSDTLKQDEPKALSCISKEIDGTRSRGKDSIASAPLESIQSADSVPAVSDTVKAHSEIEIDKSSENNAGMETNVTTRQALALAISQERSNPKYLRGMSRATVKAHVLLQGGKIPRTCLRTNSLSKSAIESTSKPSDMLDPAEKNESTTNGTQYKTSVVQKTGSNAGEESTSSRGFSLRSCGRRSSGEESLKGSRFIQEEGKSSSGSLSNHSAGIQGYLQFLEERYDEDAKSADCLSSAKSFEKLKEHTKTIGDKAVAEALDILSDLNLSLDYEDDYSSDGDDEDIQKLPTAIHSAPIPSYIPNANALLFGDDNSCSLQGHTLAATKSELSSDERQLKSYEDRWRLSQTLLLADNSARPAIGSTRLGVVEFEKSQIDRMGLSRQRRNASVTSSHESTASCDEFYDAVSRNSSSSSVD